MFNKVFGNFKGDLFGGITTGVIALPLALAFGVASGAGATAGLYGAIIVGFFASIFGGTKPQISGPTGPMTVVLAGIVATYPENFKLVFATIILAGVFQILFGVLKTGKLIKYVPYPVISGFMSGIGVIIILLKINSLLGINSEGTPLMSLLTLIKDITFVDIKTTLLGLATLLIVFLTPSKIAKKVPPALIALVGVTFASVFLGWDVKTIGDIPTGFPAFNFPMISINELMVAIPIALTLATLGSVDSLLTSLVSDSITKTKHDSNKELIGQGLGNMIAGAFGGIAGAGATMRTVINIKSGGKTPLSGVFHSLFLVTILLGAAPLAKFIPMTVLSGILIKVGFDIIDYKFIKFIKNIPRNDLIVMFVVFLLTVFKDLIFAVGAGIVLAAILFVENIAKQMNVNFVEQSDTHKVEDKSIQTIKIDGPLFFGSTSKLQKRIAEIKNAKCIIIDCKQTKSMDLTAVFALEDIIENMKSQDINVMLVLNNRNVTKRLQKLGLLDILNTKCIFYSQSEALEKAKSLMQEDENHTFAYV